MKGEADEGVFGFVVFSSSLSSIQALLLLFILEIIVFLFLILTKNKVVVFYFL
jgi:hypothetical protein